MRDNKRQHDHLIALGRPDEPTDVAVYREFVRLCDAGEAVALVTVIGEKGSSPRGMGASMVVRSDGSIAGTVGGGSLELLVIEHSLAALADGRARRLFYDYSGGRGQNLEKACMGKTEFLVQPRLKSPHMIVFGAGHVAAALAPVAETAGFCVTVVDDRPGYPRPTDFAPSVNRLHGPFPEIIAALDFDANTTYGVIVTYGHIQDQAVLGACLHRPWRYMGMIGSQAKVARVFSFLATDDDARERLARVHAPIGVDLGGRAPGEIAIGIIAELVAVRNGRDTLRFLCTTRRAKVVPGCAISAADGDAGDDADDAPETVHLPADVAPRERPSSP